MAQSHLFTLEVLPESRKRGPYFIEGRDFLGRVWLDDELVILLATSPSLPNAAASRNRFESKTALCQGLGGEPSDQVIGEAEAVERYLGKLMIAETSSLCEPLCTY